MERISFTVKEGDTTMMEKVRLTYDNNAFHYIPDVSGDQPPIDFTITLYDGSSFVAENPQHDFPWIIRYRFVKKENQKFIEASVEGNGKIIPYNFQKIE